MRILLSNDDGIHAPGIAVLKRAVSDLGEVRIVAPDVERSAAGHAITLFDPLKSAPVEKEGEFFGDAISGTPADCVKLAFRAIMKDTPPDLILSGVNFGDNTGISIIYSGTVSAATEGVILGVPSVAFSLCTYKNPQWDMVERMVEELAKKIIANPPPPGVLLNINMPNLPYDEVKGVKITRMGRSRFVETFHKRHDPRGQSYYWLEGNLEINDGGDDYDIHAVKDGYVSVTPIQFDLTAYDAMDSVKYLENV